MVILEGMPSIAQIRSLKGVIDFYYCKGVPCARAYPRKPRLTPALQRTHNSMRQGIASWNKLPQVDIQAFTFATDQSELIHKDMFLSNFLSRPGDASVVYLVNISLVGNMVRIDVNLAQGDRPEMGYKWCDSNSITEYLIWKIGYARTRGYPFGKRDQPYFSNILTTSGVWVGNTGTFGFQNEERILFFHFLDPRNHKPFSSGVYHHDFRP